MQDCCMKCFDDETQKRKGLSLQCVRAFVCVYVCRREGAEGERGLHGEGGAWAMSSTVNTVQENEGGKGVGSRRNSRCEVIKI